MQRNGVAPFQRIYPQSLLHRLMPKPRYHLVSYSQTNGAPARSSGFYHDRRIARLFYQGNVTVGNYPTWREHSGVAGDWYDDDTDFRALRGNSWFNDTAYCRSLPQQPRHQELLHRFSSFSTRDLPENLNIIYPELRA